MLFKELMQAEGDRRRSFLGKSKNPKNIFKGLIFLRECGRFMHRGRTKITATNSSLVFPDVPTTVITRTVPVLTGERSVKKKLKRRSADIH